MRTGLVMPFQPCDLQRVLIRPQIKKAGIDVCFVIVHSLTFDMNSLTLKAPIRTAADDVNKNLFIVFQRK